VNLRQSDRLELFRRYSSSELTTELTRIAIMGIDPRNVRRGDGVEENGRDGISTPTSASDDELAVASVLPRVLVVSRRTVRKNKFVDFVGTGSLQLFD
jgi:hypothetical protein